MQKNGISCCIRYLESRDIAKTKMLRSDWFIHKFAYIYLDTNLSCYLKTDFDVFLYKESDS